MAFVYLTNAIGPACVSQKFLPLDERSVKRTIVNISSTLGSVGARHTEVYSSYSMTKAALNMLVSVRVVHHHRTMSEVGSPLL